MSFIGIGKEQYVEIYDSISDINRALKDTEYSNEDKLNLIKVAVEEIENNL